MSAKKGRSGILEDTVRAICRRRNLAASTERTYLYWIKRFVRYHGLRHPNDLDEAQRLLMPIGGPRGLVARLLYGAGLRIMEGVTLRVKDIDFDYGIIHLQAAKGQKDRKTMRPDRLNAVIREHLKLVKHIHEADVAAGTVRFRYPTRSTESRERLHPTGYGSTFFPRLSGRPTQKPASRVGSECTTGDPVIRRPTRRPSSSVSPAE